MRYFPQFFSCKLLARYFVERARYITATNLLFSSEGAYIFNTFLVGTILTRTMDALCRARTFDRTSGPRTHRGNLIDAEIATKSSSLHNGSFPFPAIRAIIDVSHGERGSPHYHAPPSPSNSPKCRATFLPFVPPPGNQTIPPKRHPEKRERKERREKNISNSQERT